MSFIVKMYKKISIKSFNINLFYLYGLGLIKIITHERICTKGMPSNFESGSEVQGSQDLNKGVIGSAQSIDNSQIESNKNHQNNMNLDHEDNLDDLPEACSEEGYDDEQEESEDSGPESEITEDRKFLRQILTT